MHSDCSKEGSDLLTDSTDERLDDSYESGMEGKAFSDEDSGPDRFGHVGDQQSEDKHSTAQ